VLGLSVVHINRTMKQLRQQGAVVFKSGSVTLRDPERLAVQSLYQSPASAREESPAGTGSPARAGQMAPAAERRATA
jgi:hypothetical protein